MPNAAEAATAAISGGGPLWFPGLAPTLAAQVAAAPGRAWVDEHYGTERWLAGDESAPCDAVATIAHAGGGRSVLERPGPATRARFDALTFVDPRTEAPAILRDSSALLTSLPGLGDLLASLTRTIHVLAAEPGYDVSHSDPSVPFSIFVSVPKSSESHAVARLAESILHETLHLQLTLIEGVCPLVAEPLYVGYSPWQACERPLGGLLHGAYVFAGIREGLTALARQRACIDAYADRRQREIADELRVLPRHPNGLTTEGTHLWARAIEVGAF
jgi:HEXXH motif-containing protein